MRDLAPVKPKRRKDANRFFDETVWDYTGHPSILYQGRAPATQSKNGKYIWSEEDVADLEQILALRELGLSIKSIQRIKTLHETQCGTMAQWTENRQILLDDLADKEAQIAELTLQIQQVKNLLQKLEDEIAQNKRESGTKIDNSSEFDFVVPPPHS